MIHDSSQVVFHFTLKLADGSVADSSKPSGKPARLVMGDGSVSPVFEAQLLGRQAGQTLSFSLQPEDAYGLHQADRVQHLEASRFSADITLQEGTIVAFDQPNGSQLAGIIRSVVGESVTVDFNHPLAGQTVAFEIEILDVSEAS